MVWRKAIGAAWNDSVSYGHLIGGRAQQIVNQACSVNGSTYTPTAELSGAWTSLYPTAQGATPYNNDSGLGIGSSAVIYSDGTNTHAQVDVARAVQKLVLPVNRPVDGYPVDGARFLIFTDLQYNPNTVPPGAMTVHAAPVAASYTVSDADWTTAGTSIGSASFTQQGTSTVYLSTFDVDPSVVLDPSGTQTSPKLRPALRVHFLSQEPPAGWPPSSLPPGANCAWAQNRLITSSAVLFREQLPPLSAPPAHIGTASVSLSPALTRLAGELRAEAERLDAEKQAVEAALPGAQAALTTASDAYDAATEKLAPVSKEISKTQSFIRKIGIIDKKLPPDVQADVEARESLEESIAATQEKLLDAKRARNAKETKKQKDKLADLESNLAVIEKSLQGKSDQLDATRERWLSKLRVLKNQLFRLKAAEAGAHAKRAEANAALQALLGRRTTADTAMLAAAEKLKLLDIQLKRAEVRADGVLVFAADLTGTAPQLQALDGEIAELSPIVAQLDAQRRSALQQFLNAQHKARLALNTVTNRIMGVAAAKAGVETVFFAYDELKAFAKGGLVGAGTEAVKKLLEFAVTYSPPYKDVAPELNFTQQYLDWMSTTAISDAGLEVVGARLVKDTVSKNVKDYANVGLTNYLERTLGRVPGLYVVPGVPSPASRTDKVVGALTKFLEWSTTEAKALENLRKGPYAATLAKLSKQLLKTFSKQAGIELLKESGKVGGDLVTGIAKDVAKNGAKAYFDLKEQQAWLDYYEAEILAQTYFPFYAMTADAYWKAYDHLRALQDEKARLLAGYNPATQTQVTLDQSFSVGAQLTVTVTLTSAQPVSMGTTVADRAGTPAGTYSWTLTSAGLTQGLQGLGLGLEVR
jgi:hypothetical protein